MTDFYDESLANGLVRGWARTVKEVNLRKRTNGSRRDLTNLFTSVKTGIPKNKRSKHYQSIVTELSKANAIIPYIQPGVTPRAQKSVGILLRVRIQGTGDKETFMVTNILLDYKNKTVYEEISDAQDGGFVVAFNSNHVFARFIQRENRNVFSEAIVRFYDAVINCSRDFDEAEVGPANILISNGGMLLGEITMENGRKRYLANTYISSSQVMAHNFANLYIPDVEKFKASDEEPLITLSTTMAKKAYRLGNIKVLDKLVQHNILIIKHDITDNR